MVVEFLSGLPNWELVLFFFLIFAFLSAGLTATIIVLGRMRWNFKVVLFEELNGNLQIVGRDRARLIRFGDGGEEVFYLKKKKKYRVAYGKRIGKNQIAWCIAEDGYWYNFIFQDLNKKLLEVGVMPVDRDIRMANASIRKGIDQEFKAKNFMDKYGMLIYGGMFFMVLISFAGVIWFTFDKLGEVNSATLKSSEIAKEVSEVNLKTMEKINELLGKTGVSTLVDNPTGSGLVPV